MRYRSYTGRGSWMRGAHEHEHHRKQSNCYENMNNNGAKRKNKDCRILVISGAAPLLRLPSLWDRDKARHAAKMAHIEADMVEEKKTQPAPSEER